MPDLLRRAVALTVLSALGSALLAPLTARSALSDVPVAVEPLLADFSAPTVTLDRGLTADRATASGLTLAAAAAPELVAVDALPTPASARMQATLVPISTPPPAPAAAPVAASPSVNGVVDLSAAAWALVTDRSRGAGIIDVTLHLGS